MNLDKWLDKCDAALKAMRYLEKMHGKNAKQEAEIALRYARAIEDQEAAEAFEIILNCIDIEQASKAAH